MQSHFQTLDGKLGLEKSRETSASETYMQYKQSELGGGAMNRQTPQECECSFGLSGLRLFCCHPTAYWDATRAFMILSLLACFIGIVIGVMAFIHYSSFDGFDKTFAAGILFFISCKLLGQRFAHPSGRDLSRASLSLIRTWYRYWSILSYLSWNINLFLPILGCESILLC